MLKLIKSSTYRSMPWKNGQGVTEEIQISPADSVFPNDKFFWRLSSATVHSRNSFSLLPGFDRWLAVWQGEGLWLNQKSLAPMAPFLFAGETEIDCALQGKEVIDVGLMFRRDLYSATMKVRNFATNEILTTAEGTTLLFLADGEISIDGQVGDIGDTFRIDGSHSIDVHPAGTSRCLLVHLSQRKS